MSLRHCKQDIFKKFQNVHFLLLICYEAMMHYVIYLIDLHSYLKESLIPMKVVK